MESIISALRVLKYSILYVLQGLCFMSGAINLQISTCGYSYIFFHTVRKREMHVLLVGQTLSFPCVVSEHSVVQCVVLEQPLPLLSALLLMLHRP